MAKDVLLSVYQALLEKGYNPINQMVGYLLSGDPAYITSHKDARNLIRKLERDELWRNWLDYLIKKKYWTPPEAVGSSFGGKNEIS